MLFNTTYSSLMVIGFHFCKASTFFLLLLAGRGDQVTVCAQKIMGISFIKFLFFQTQLFKSMTENHVQTDDSKIGMWVSIFFYTGLAFQGRVKFHN